MKKTHQEAIAEIVYNILQMPVELRTAFSRGNPFDKLLRSYSEFTSQGEPLYRNKRCKDYYPFSINAYNHFNSLNTMDGLHAEHIVPLSIIKKELLHRTSYSLEKVKAYLSQNNKIVVITKAEQKIIDSAHKSSVPEDGFSRIEYYNIKIAKPTQNNTLNIKK